MIQLFMCLFLAGKIIYMFMLIAVEKVQMVKVHDAQTLKIWLPV
jgi:hypothetical protein